jgi:hypothetical protein
LGLSTEVPPWHAFTVWRWNNQSRRYNRNRIVNHCHDRGLASRFQGKVAMSDLDVLTRIQSSLAALQATRPARSLPPDVQRLSGPHPGRSRRLVNEIRQGTGHANDGQIFSTGLQSTAGFATSGWPNDVMKRRAGCVRDARVRVCRERVLTSTRLYPAFFHHLAKPSIGSAPVHRIEDQPLYLNSDATRRTVRWLVSPNRLSYDRLWPSTRYAPRTAFLRSPGEPDRVGTNLNKGQSRHAPSLRVISPILVLSWLRGSRRASDTFVGKAPLLRPS